MTYLNEPNQSILSREKVKLALVSFLLSQDLCVTQNGVQEQSEALRYYIDECIIDSDFKAQIACLSDACTIDIDQCVTELTSLFAVTAKQMGLESIFLTRTELWTMHYLNPCLIKNVMKNSDLIAIASHRFSGDGACSNDWVISMQVAKERYAITLREGSLLSTSISADNDCTIQAIDESFERSKGSIHSCAVMAMSWFAYQVYWSNQNQKCFEKKDIMLSVIPMTGNC